MSTTVPTDNPYHMVSPGPWPAMGSLGGFLFFAGFLLFLHPSLAGGMADAVAGMGGWLFAPGLGVLLYTMYGWWRDVVGEAEEGTAHTSIVQLGLRYGVVLFIISEVFFFFGFFWAFFNAAMVPMAVLDGSWPPAGVTTFNAFELPLLNTLILLLSSCTVTWAHHAIRVDDRVSAVRGLTITVGLGVLFSILQAYEYAHAPFGFADGIYSSTFYMATGFHGFHVIVGTCFLLVCLLRLLRGHFTADRHFGFEAAAWYWHFVDAVWICLFVSIYVWGS